MAERFVTVTEGHCESCLKPLFDLNDFNGGRLSFPAVIPVAWLYDVERKTRPCPRCGGEAVFSLSKTYGMHGPVIFDLSARERKDSAPKVESLPPED